MKLAVFTKNRSNPAYAAARLGAERAAAPFGATVMHYVPETPDDPVQQSALVHEALATRPDAFVFTPVHATKVDAAVEEIRRAGIPLHGFVNRMAPGLSISYCGSSDAQLAERIAEHLFDHLQGRGEVAIVEGPQGSVTSIERVQAFDAAARRHPGIRIAARCHGNYLREPAREAFASLRSRTPRLDAVLCANDIMALGVLDVLRAAGQRLPVVGVNAIPEAIAAIRDGEMLASADFNAMQMCALATECAIRHARGEAVPREIELPVRIVTHANWTEWDLPYAERPLLTLAQLDAACTAAS